MNGMNDNIDDLLGPTPQPVPAAPPVVRTRKPRKTAKVNDLLGKARKYEPLKSPKNPDPGGIFAAREAKGKNLGRTCLIASCKAELKHTRGRPPVICRKKSCFRAYRSLYRHDYDKARS